MHHTLHLIICTCICNTCGFVHTRHRNLQVHMVFHDSPGVVCVCVRVAKQTDLGRVRDLAQNTKVWCLR